MITPPPFATLGNSGPTLGQTCTWPKMMQRLLLPWLLVVAHARPPTLPKNELLARAATIDAFFRNGTAPKTWTVRSRDDVQGPYNDIYNKAKHVSRAHVKGKRVVVKSGGPHETEPPLPRSLAG